MPEPAAGPVRADLSKGFKFRVKWDGKYVAGVSRMSALRRSSAVIEEREGSDPPIWRKSPGQTRFDPIVLERGITFDAAFEDFANLVNVGAGVIGAEVGLWEFRKDIVIELYNDGGQLIRAYNVYRCWVSEYQALPDLDANANAVAFEHIKIENEGWERDASVPEPLRP
ncbi:MAG TPA: phage tail protein [Candidatus Baltobacteraceae bacterium]|nr:phage tail protein [Candidatus Baltobacteraceae bacterium]